MRIGEIREGKVGHDHPWTSHEAATKNVVGFASQRVRVFRMLKTEGLDNGTNGLTDNQLHHALNIVRSGACVRRKELTEWGLVVDSGRTRLTDTESNAIVWVMTERGMENTEEEIKPSIMAAKGYATLPIEENPNPNKKRKKPGRKTVEKLYDHYAAKFVETESEFYDGVWSALGWVLGKNKAP